MVERYLPKSIADLVDQYAKPCVIIKNNYKLYIEKIQDLPTSLQQNLDSSKILVSDQSIYCLSRSSLYLYKQRKFRCIINLEKLFRRNKLSFPHNYSSVIYNSELFVIGGIFKGDSQNTVYKINLQSRRITQLSSLINNVYGSSSIVVDDMICTIGGNEHRDYFNPLCKINCYNIKDDGWTKMEDTVEGTFKPILLYYKNNIYICSTDFYAVSISRYNPQKNKSYWCARKTYKTNHLSAFIEGDRICLITTTKIFYYDLHSDLWEEKDYHLLNVNSCATF